MSASGKHPGLTTRLDPEFGPWLKRMRRERGLGLDEFTRAVRFSQSTLSSLESAQNLNAAWTVGMFAGIARALNMELSYILHKAGFEVAAGGLDTGRLGRLERAVQAFVEDEHELRATLAEAIDALEQKAIGSARKDVPLEDLVTGSWLREFAQAHTEEGSPDRRRLGKAADALDEYEESASITVRDAEREQVTARLGRLLARVDFIATKIRGEGLQVSHERTSHGRTSRPWSAEEINQVRANPELSFAELSARLGRTAEAVRYQRRLLDKPSQASGGRS